MRYWVYQDSQILGPLERDEMTRLEALGPGTLVCREEAPGSLQSDWRSLTEIAELAELGARPAARVGSLPEPEPSGSWLLEDDAVYSRHFSGRRDPGPAEEAGPSLWWDAFDRGSKTQRSAAVESETRRREFERTISRLNERIEELESQQRELMSRLLETGEPGRPLPAAMPSNYKDARQAPAAGISEPKAALAVPPPLPEIFSFKMPAPEPEPPPQVDAEPPAQSAPVKPRFKVSPPKAWPSLSPQPPPEEKPGTLRFSAPKTFPRAAGETKKMFPVASAPKSSAAPGKLHIPPAARLKPAGEPAALPQIPDLAPRPSEDIGPPPSPFAPAGMAPSESLPPTDPGPPPSSAMRGAVPSIAEDAGQVPSPFAPPDVVPAVPSLSPGLTMPPLSAPKPMIAPLPMSSPPIAPPSFIPAPTPPTEPPAPKAAGPAAAPPMTMSFSTPATPPITVPQHLDAGPGRPDPLPGKRDGPQAPSTPSQPAPSGADIAVHTQEVLSRLAKPRDTMSTTAPKAKKRQSKFALIISLSFVGLLVLAVLFFRNTKEIKMMFNMGAAQRPLGAENEDSPAPKLPVQPLQPVAPPPQPRIESVPDPSPAAIELVKQHPLDGGRGTVGQWLQYSFAANPGDAAKEKWNAGAVSASTYLVQYSVPASGSAGGAISYLFEADVSAKTVKGNNPAAKSLLAVQAPAPAAKAPKKPGAARRKAARAPAAPKKPLPQLPLPAESDLAPPAEDGSQFSSDTIN